MLTRCLGVTNNIVVDCEGAHTHSAEHKGDFGPRPSHNPCLPCGCHLFVQMRPLAWQPHRTCEACPGSYTSFPCCIA